MNKRKPADKILEIAQQGGGDAELVLNILERLDELEGNIQSPTDQIEKTATKLAAKLAYLEKGEKGDKGDKGDSITGPQGPKGEDSMVPGPRGLQGPAGKDGVDGKNGKDGRDGRDGRDGQDGNDGSPDTPDQIIEKINTSSLLIKRDRIEGLLDIIQNVAHGAIAGVGITTNFFNGLRAKNLTIQGIGNATVTSSQQGDMVTVTVDVTGSGALTVLTATGTVDGSNTSFDFTSKPTFIVSDGVQYRENHGWTWSGTTATLSVAPAYDIYGIS